MTVSTHSNEVQGFEDQGNEASTNGLCGTRSYKLVDSSGVDNAISWITIVNPGASTTHEITLQPRAESQPQTISMKLHITAVDYPQNTAVVPFTINLSGECQFPSLQTPQDTTITDPVFVIDGTVKSKTIKLFTFN